MVSEELLDELVKLPGHRKKFQLAIMSLTGEVSVHFVSNLQPPPLFFGIAWEKNVRRLTPDRTAAPIDARL